MSDIVTIWRAGKNTPRLELLLIGDDQPTGGVGGWEITDRAGRRPMTGWVGVPGLQWILPLSFDGGPAELSVENAIQTLTSWGQPTGKNDAPPELRVWTNLGRVPQRIKWVIQDIEWLDQVRNAAEQRTRQDINLTLVQYIPGRVLKGPAARSRDKGKGKK